MFAAFFVDRPVFSTVLSLVIVLLGGVALMGLPIAQYPEVTPPTVSVTAVYPGASAQVVADTVAAPLEQEINGIENMLYLSSRSTNDGQCTIDVTFEVGTDINFAQVLTQNRVSIAEPKLPEEVRRQGVTVKKKSPSILLVVNLISPDGRYDRLFLSNFATTQIKDTIARLEGVGDVNFLGARDYSMRIWLNPEKMASLNLSASDVVKAVQEQNVQVAAGRIGQSPAPADQQIELIINTQGRLLEPDEFSNIVVKTDPSGRNVYLSDVAHTELGSKNYDVISYLDGKPAIAMACFQLPGSNALATAERIRKTMEDIKKSGDFPEGMDYRIVYDTTIFIDESVHEVYKTLFEAFVLVFLVVLIFLQDWRATLMPMIDVPVSLIGTFAIMSLMGFSLNNLSLFGLVLAIGIVVDDAIVVVENIERWLHKGVPIREATIQAMNEITGPVIAITLVLSSVFIPTAFIAGISGEFYRQFALTIATATIISAFNAMTMAPSRAAQIFKPKPGTHPGDEEHREPLPRWGNAMLGAALSWYLLAAMIGTALGISIPGEGHSEASETVATAHGPIWQGWALLITILAVGALLGWFLHPLINKILKVFFKGFNAVFDSLSNFYGATVARLVRVGTLMLLLYVGMMYVTYEGFMRVPTGFIPPQDKGYLALHCQLPDGASLERSDHLMEQVQQIVHDHPGVAHTIGVPGYSIINSANLTNTAGMFVVLDPFEKRAGVKGLSADEIGNGLRRKLSKLLDAQILVFGAPPVDGLGNTGGFKLFVEDRGAEGAIALQQAVNGLAEAGNQQRGLIGLFSTFRATQPQLYVEIDREKVKSLNLSLSDVNNTLQTYLGSAYANDFTAYGRNWQVNIQADSKFRSHADDIGLLKVRSPNGEMIPLSTLVRVKDTTGPAIVYRYNMYPAAEINGATLPGVSSGQAISMMEQLAKNELPQSMKTEWTELTLLQILAGNTAVFVFLLGTILVYFVLSAQYESWSLSLAVILIVPMCLLAAIAGVWINGSDNNIFTQIGLVVLIGLAAKNAILIVEFAKQRQGEGLSRRDAIVDACKVRLRPILMTSFAFILGVVPLVLGVGAGAEMRNALGIAVFSGMLGVTAFGLLFTPIFYDTIMWWNERRAARHQSVPAGPPPTV